MKKIKYILYDRHNKKNNISLKAKEFEYNDETSRLGKIYINYPMIESYYHLEKLPDPNYNDRTISLENLNGTTYKKLVNTTSCIKKNKFNEVDISYVIMHNYNKAKYITGNKSKEVDYK